tara:strand:- start:201 stop:464 length:264 start_codon:yes stop_codon:yes gene_type:complete
MKYPKLIGFKAARELTGLSNYELSHLIERGVLTAIVPVSRKRKLIYQQLVQYMDSVYERAERISQKPIQRIPAIGRIDDVSSKPDKD